MNRIVEQITDGIIHVFYSLDETGIDNEPICFSYNDKCVLMQEEVKTIPQTELRYISDTDGFKKKMTANGEVSYTESMQSIPAREMHSVKIKFTIGDNEMLLGLGQYEDGILNYRNHTEYLYESNMRIAIPFLVTTGNYGIMIDSESCQIFKSEGNTIKFFIDSAETLSYYVFLGKDIKEIISRYHWITGKPSMLPRWAFGYIQSKERYKTGDELESVTETFRKRKIPIDCIVQDWHSWEEGLWGEKKFDKTRYPDLKSIVGKLHENNVHFMVSIWPNMSSDSGDYKEFAEKDMLLPNSNVYDAFDENARNLYWKQCRKEIMESGTDALWCDNAEPFSDADWSGISKKIESERYKVVTDASRKSMKWDRINSYGLYHAKGIYENWRKDYTEKRVLNLTRSGYTGIQKYGAILWSGDITATYDTLRKQIVEGIKMGLTGMPYWTLDIGGFFVVNDKYENRGCDSTDRTLLWFWKGDYNEGVKDAAYRELYVRWLEFGTFLPIFRSHGTDTPREPWQFGDEGDPFYDAIVANIRLRYRLMPYIYSIAAAAHMNGEIMMRGLAYDFPDDENALTVTDEYLLGPSVLVAPVYTPMYYSVGSTVLNEVKKSRSVYLPEGCGWYDFYTDEYYEGGQTIEADAPLDRIPIFIREGSIIPFSDDISYADEKDGKVSKVRVYEGCDAAFTMYFDRGDGYEFENGEYSLVKLHYTEESKKLIFTKVGKYPVDDSFDVEYLSRKQN